MARSMGPDLQKTLDETHILKYYEISIAKTL